MLLFGFPMYKLWRATRNIRALERTDGKARESLYRPTMFSLLLGYIFTREPIWFVGFLIFAVWTAISAVSYKYFRPSLDSIAKQDIEQGEVVVDQWVFVALLISSLALSIGILTNLSYGFLSDLFKTSAQIALTLVGFLLALQGIVSNASLRSETERLKRFEMRTILGLMEGLTGFMLIFLGLFLVSLVGVFVTQNPGTLQMTTSWLLSPLSISASSMFELATLALLSIFVTTLSLSIVYLYRLFLAGHLVIVPLKTALLAKPVLIEKTIDHTDSPQLEEQIITTLSKTSELNGMIINQIMIHQSDDEKLHARLELEIVLPDKQELIQLARTVGKTFIDRLDFDRVRVSARCQQGSLGLWEVFHVELDQEALEFLNRDDGLSLEYKFEQLNPRFWSPAFKESQIM